MVLLTAMAIIATGCTKPDDPNNGSGGGNNGGNSSVNTIGGHEYVDFGLPSGTLWATCNIGADKPEDLGSGFAWASIMPFDSIGTAVYGNHPCNAYWDDVLQQYIKYYDGDNLCNLLPEDDVAAIKWGNGWRMPTKEEFEELLSYCSHSFRTHDDRFGILIYQNNSDILFNCTDSIYLPAYYLGEYGTLGGAYWTNERQSENHNYESKCFVYGIDLHHHTNAEIQDELRWLALSVRPVHSQNNNGGGNNGGGTTNSYTINISTNPNDGGTITGAGTYQHGESCTLTATAKSGYTFTNWTENGTVVSTQANFSFGVITNRTLVANFTPIPLAVTDFEWYRQGTTQTGLGHYGLNWVGNYKSPYAQIKPLDGVTLYSFDNSSWNATNTDVEKTALFANSGQMITVYNNVDVNYYNSTYDDVIGTKMADGTLHLIHVTSCTSSSSPGGVICTIHGQSK